MRQVVRDLRACHAEANERIERAETERREAIALTEQTVSMLTEERARAARAEARADTLRERVDSAERDLAVAQHDAEAAQQAAAELRLADEARKARAGYAAPGTAGGGGSDAGGRRSPADCPARRVAATGGAAKPLGEAQDSMAGTMSDRPAALAHPPSWATTTPPPPGAWCRACHGTGWWTEQHQPRGWRCVTCHPPAHLAAEAIRGEGQEETAAGRTPLWSGEPMSAGSARNGYPASALPTT